MDGKELYIWLSNPENLKDVEWEKKGKGDGMSVLYISIGQWWKPIFLMDDRKKTAVQFMDMNEYLLTVSDDDIDWSTVTPRLGGYKQAKSKYAGFPTNIRPFKKGVATVEWQINPDGQYYMDSDGYGMTSDIEESLYGVIDRNGRVVVKFYYDS